MKTTLAIAAIASIVLLLPGTALAEQCTDKWQQKQSIDDAYDAVVWSEIGIEETFDLIICTSDALDSGGPATPLMFECFLDLVGPVALELAAAVGEELAAQILYDLFETQQPQYINDVAVGVQVWQREECLPSCDSKWKLCVPMPPSTAFYVAWDYDEIFG